MVTINLLFSNENAALACTNLPREEGETDKQVLQKHILEEVVKLVADAQTKGIVSPHQNDIEAIRESVRQNQGNNPN